jgi:hypothetical protein
VIFEHADYQFSFLSAADYCRNDRHGSSVAQRHFLVGDSGAAAPISTATVAHLGEHVIPKIDKDPEVSTARYRPQAAS